MMILALLFSFSAHAQSVDAELVDTGHMNHEPASALFTDKYRNDVRQHTFIQLFNTVNDLDNPKGIFGYHISEFGSNHQHQVIVRANNTITGKTLSASTKLIKTVLAKGPNNKYYTVTSDKPRFLLNEVILGKRRSFPTDLYDGVISRTNPPLKKPWEYNILELVYTTPMIAEDKILDQATYIIFGYDKPGTKYFLAHLIHGADNFDQVLTVTLPAPLDIPDGTLVVIDGVPGKIPLNVGATYAGRYGNQSPVGFTVDKEIRNNLLAKP